MVKRLIKSSAVHAWLIWSLSAFFMFYKNAIEVSLSVMTGELMSEFSINGTQLGSLAASYFYAYLIMQIPAGFLIDRFGPKKITTISIAFCGIGSILFAHATGLTSASIGRFLTGVGASFAAINCIKLITNWFPTSRVAFMTGLMMTVGMLGAVGGQAPLSYLIHQEGWRLSIQGIGFFGIALSVLFFLCVENHPRNKEVHVAPQNMKFLSAVKQVVSNKTGWLLSLYSGLAFAPVLVFGGLWGVPFLVSFYSLSPTQASHSVSLIFIGFAIGAPLSGWFSDWMKSRLIVMRAGTWISLVTILLILYTPPISVNILNGLLLLFGASISGFLVCFTMIREINKPILAATAIGFMNAFDAFFGAISEPLSGFILDLNWTGELFNGAPIFTLQAYKIALSILPLYLIGAVISLRFMKETYKKEERIENFP